jgi:uncharacterized membrane protein
MISPGIMVYLFSIGFFTGLRAMTPIAVLCWMTAIGRLPAAQGWLSFAANKISVVVFSLAALGELIGDKLPSAPSRTKPPGLIARVVFGAFCAMILASTIDTSIYLAAILGAIGAVTGTFAGWWVRTRAVTALRCPDFPIALLEDAITLTGSCLVALIFAHG